MSEMNVDKEKVDMWLESKKKLFSKDNLLFLKEKLYRLDENRFIEISSMSMKQLGLKGPGGMLAISIFLGTLGIDRFMLQETGMGVLKLLTAGCCGILTVIDWFTIGKRVREKNFNTLMLRL